MPRPSKAGQRPALRYSDGTLGFHGGSIRPSGLWTPRRATRRRQDRGRKTLAHVTCPRCDHSFGSIERFGMAICDCGWLLKIEPLPMGGVSVDDVMMVAFDGQVNEQLLLEAVRRIRDYWERKGIASFEKNDIRGRYRVKLPDFESIEDLEQDRADRRALGQDTPQ